MKPQHRNIPQENVPFSTFQLLSSHTLKPVLSLCFLLLITQIAVFIPLAQVQKSASFSLENVVPNYIWGNHPFFDISSIITLVAVSALCLLESTVSKGKYTLLRLGISYQTLFFSATFNTICTLILLWATQVIALLFGLFCYIHVTPTEFLAPQSVFLSTTHSNYLHEIFPTVNIDVWMKNITEIILLSLSMANVSLHQLEGKPWKIWVILPIFVVVNYFYSHVYTSIRIFTLIYGIFIIMLLLGVCRHEKRIQKFEV